MCENLRTNASSLRPPSTCERAAPRASEQGREDGKARAHCIGWPRHKAALLSCHGCRREPRTRAWRGRSATAARLRPAVPRRTLSNSALRACSWSTSIEMCSPLAMPGRWPGGKQAWSAVWLAANRPIQGRDVRAHIQARICVVGATSALCRQKRSVRLGIEGRLLRVDLLRLDAPIADVENSVGVALEVRVAAGRQRWPRNARETEGPFAGEARLAGASARGVARGRRCSAGQQPRRALRQGLTA